MKPNCPVLKGSKPASAVQPSTTADSSREIEELKQELASARGEVTRNTTPQVAKRVLDDLRLEFRNQISDMRREIGAIGRSAPHNHANTAKAVRTEEDRQTQVVEPRQSCGGCCNVQTECPVRTSLLRDRTI